MEGIILVVLIVALTLGVVARSEYRRLVALQNHSMKTEQTMEATLIAMRNDIKALSVMSELQAKELVLRQIEIDRLKNLLEARGQ